MANGNAKTHKFMSVCALSLAGLTAFGSVFAVAAAATAPEQVTAEAATEAADTSVFHYLYESGEYHVLSAHEIEVKNGDESVKVVVKDGTPHPGRKDGRAHGGRRNKGRPAALRHR